MQVIKVPDRNCTFDIEHEFIREISGADGDVLLDLRDTRKIYSRVLAFIVHYGKVKKRIRFCNVGPEFREEYGEILSVALGTNFKDMIEEDEL